MLAKRDLAVMLLSAFAVYYSLQRDGVITFNRAWHLPDERGSGDGVTMHYGVDDHPPVPVFFDLNGDGEKEIILASQTGRPEIRIAALPDGSTSKGGNKGGGAPAGDGDVFAAVKTMVRNMRRRTEAPPPLAPRLPPRDTTAHERNESGSERPSESARTACTGLGS